MVFRNSKMTRLNALTSISNKQLSFCFKLKPSESGCFRKYETDSNFVLGFSFSRFYTKRSLPTFISCVKCVFLDYECKSVEFSIMQNIKSGSEEPAIWTEFLDDT